MCVSGLLNLTYLPQNLKSWVFLKLFMTKIVRTRLTKLRTPRLYEFQHVRNAPAFEWGRTNPDFYACYPVRRLKKRWFLYGNNFCNLQPYPDSRLPPSIACTLSLPQTGSHSSTNLSSSSLSVGDMRLPSALPVVLKNTFYRLHGL